jgi:rod shape-determining protein MreD
VRLALLFVIAAFLALSIQTAVPLSFPLHGLVPNLIVILAVDLGLRHHGALPAFIAFGMGYAVDAFSGTRLGLNAFLITLVFLLTFEVSSRLLVTNVMVGMLAVFLGAILVGAGGVAITSGGNVPAAVSAVMPAVLVQAAASAIVAPPVFAILRALKSALGLRPKPPAHREY